MRDEILKYYQIADSVYFENNLLCLGDNQYEPNGRNVMTCPNNPNYNEEKFIHFANLSDIIKCSEDLKYFCGQLYLHQPYINDPLNEFIFLGEKKVSTYFQNFYDRRYSMFITCCFEKSYNYWDRIGDRIASFFPDKLKIHQVDFTRIIDAIAKDNINESEHLKWLVEFRENGYVELNGYRKDMVHYYQFEANYRFQHTMNNMDFEKLEELWKEKTGFPLFFKNHLDLMIVGYFKMVDFLNELMAKNPKLYKK